MNKIKIVIFFEIFKVPGSSRFDIYAFMPYYYFYFTDLINIMINIILIVILFKIHGNCQYIQKITILIIKAPISRISKPQGTILHRPNN